MSEALEKKTGSLDYFSGSLYSYDSLWQVWKYKCLKEYFASSPLRIIMKNGNLSLSLSTPPPTQFGVPAVGAGRLQGVLAVLHFQLSVLLDSLLLGPSSIPVLAATFDLLHVLLLLPEQLHLGEGGVGELDVLKKQAMCPHLTHTHT